MEDLSKTPFLILGNKIDHPGAVSEDQLRHELGLYQTSRTSDKVTRSELHADLEQLEKARSHLRESGLSRSSCAVLCRDRDTERVSAGCMLKYYQRENVKKLTAVQVTIRINVPIRRTMLAINLDSQSEGIKGIG